MTDQDEGKAALEAAAKALHEMQRAPGAMKWSEIGAALRQSWRDEAADTIRTWLRALPGWRLVPVEATEAQKNTHAMEAIFDSEWSLLVELAPPPPGLEPDSHE